MVGMLNPAIMEQQQRAKLEAQRQQQIAQLQSQFSDLQSKYQTIQQQPSPAQQFAPPPYVGLGGDALAQNPMMDWHGFYSARYGQPQQQPAAQNPLANGRIGSNYALGQSILAGLR